MTVHLKDVSERAGVSTATTSRVLSGKGFVSDELRRRVLAAVQEMNYTPNGLARSMSLRKTFFLGLVVSDVTNPFFTALARGVEDMGQERGYAVVLCNTDGNLNKERSYLSMLHEKRVDGLLLSPNGAASDHVQRLIDAEIEVVLVDRVLPGIHVASVSVDNFDGVYQATKYLIALGHNRIGFVAGKEGASSADERISGFRAGMVSSGIDIDETLLVRGDFTQEGGQAAGLELYGRPQPPTAVISSNNLMTTGLLLALKSLRKLIPDDLSVISFDDLPLFSLLDHQMTVVAQPAYEMGRSACLMLIQMLEGELARDNKQSLRLPTKLIIRDSCRSLSG